MLSDPGANAALSPDDLPKDLFAPGTHLHMSGYTLLNEGSRPAAMAAFQLAGRAGMTVSVDGASAAPLERLGAEPFLELTNGVMLLVVNADQAAVLTGRDDPESAARVLTAWYPQVVVKLGPDGALHANGRPDPVRVPAQPVERFLDGTGGGDAFCAGFLPPWLDKKPPHEALTSGCRLASTCPRPGRRPAHPLTAPGRLAFLDELFSLEGRVALVTGGSSGIGRGHSAGSGAWPGRAW